MRFAAWTPHSFRQYTSAMVIESNGVVCNQPAFQCGRYIHSRKHTVSLSIGLNGRGAGLPERAIHDFQDIAITEAEKVRRLLIPVEGKALQLQWGAVCSGPARNVGFRFQARHQRVGEMCSRSGPFAKDRLSHGLMSHTHTHTRSISSTLILRAGLRPLAA